MSIFGNRRQSEPPPVIESKPLAFPVAPSSVIGFETVLGRNSTLEGSFRCTANVRIDGVFSGDLEVTGNMLIGETARITADINAKNISIAGTVNGNVNGRKVQILRTGRVKGDIRAMALTTEEGAFIDGKITMIGQEPEPDSEIAAPVSDSPPAPDTAAG
jgi:cytoskeletal protein CcmA (bactofilin family)